MADLIIPGTAGPSNVLSGQTFSAGTNFESTGTMPNNGATVLTPSGSGNVAIPAGYHNGAGYVSQVSVPAANVLVGTTIAGVAGTMPNQGAAAFTPTAAGVWGSAGYYSSVHVNGDSNLVASNIKSGVSIFGVAGTSYPKSRSDLMLLAGGLQLNAVVSGWTAALYAGSVNTAWSWDTTHGYLWGAGTADGSLNLDYALYSNVAVDLTGVQYIYLGQYNVGGSNTTTYICLSTTQSAGYGTYNYRAQFSGAAGTGGGKSVNLGSQISGSYYIRIHMVSTGSSGTFYNYLDALGMA